MTTKPMTADQRKKAFRALFDAMPGKDQSDKIDRICGILHCQPMTVRIWLVNEPKNPRIIPEAKLKILQDALARNTGKK